MEFSKRILMVAFATGILVIGMSFALMWRTGDLGPLNEIIIGVSGIIISCVTFYLWKAKAENVLKIQKTEPPDVAEKVLEVLKNGLDNS